ncbi:hypothetical protein ACFOY4_34405 [Actinomadura syzygii]|uniref:Lytic transglycosylase domain-containing protein n=1 Tax=Actinomadura syzygii TaxID=1427538 RepID=A0A5D0UKE0_9ACTN|nr:hypothetical protein [Actinomadura syzygii]TYC18848.1 hypothetical protein FXF65_03690 [Actinomadura syzygii]
MSKSSLAARTAGVTLAAALGLGVAGPAASAATVQGARTPAAVQQVGAPAAAVPAAPQSSPVTPAQQAELQRAIAAGQAPVWLNRVIKELKKRFATYLALKRAAKKGFGTFKMTWNKRVSKYIKKLVGTGLRLRLVYTYFRAAR